MITGLSRGLVKLNAGVWPWADDKGGVLMACAHGIGVIILRVAVRPDSR